MAENKRRIRIGHLNTVGGVIAELGKVYRQARRGEVDMSEAKSLVYCLRELSRHDLGKVRWVRDGSGGEALASLAAASVDDKTTPSGSHPRSEAMGLLPLAVVGLECPLHRFFRFFLTSGRNRYGRQGVGSCQESLGTRLLAAHSCSKLLHRIPALC